MKDKVKNIFFCFIILIYIIVIGDNSANASETYHGSDLLIKKVSKAYTKKFCNALGFGLSKESAMNFSIEENKKAFENKKGMNNINKELLAEEIAISVVENCGYPINLSGETGIQEFKKYYLSKDHEISK